MMFSDVDAARAFAAVLEAESTNFLHHAGSWSPAIQALAFLDVERLPEPAVRQVGFS
jgi:hypothetical protein